MLQLGKYYFLFNLIKMPTSTDERESLMEKYYKLTLEARRAGI